MAKFQPGQSGNPSGRKAIAPEIRDQIQRNGEMGVERLRQLLADNEAWGREGWLSGKEQIALAALSQDRAYGKAENVSVTHTHSGSLGMTVKSNASNNLQAISEQLPERMAQRAKVIDAKPADVVDLTVDKETKV